MQHERPFLMAEGPLRRGLQVCVGLFILAAFHLIVSNEPSHAFGPYGREVDLTCQTFNNTTPYAVQGCELCHARDRSLRLEPQWTWYQGRNLTAFCPAGNLAPVAHAGPDQSVKMGTTVTLNGSASSDLDGDPLTYQWALTVIPMNSRAMLANATTVMPSFLADMPGRYEAQLIVSDGTVAGAPDTVTVTVTPGNTAPVASAGPDQTVQTGSLVTLDGSGSSDVDGNPLTYQWAIVMMPTGSVATLSNPAAVMPTFVADKGGEYTVRLTVNDGTVNSTPDTVVITTMGGNTAPIAHAGPDQAVQMGVTVTLDGSGSSDVDGNQLTYEWAFVTMPPGSVATLSNPTAVMPTFVTDRAGRYVVSLVVNDGSINSHPDTVVITAAGGNTAPVANAGPDQTVPLGITVMLDGSGSRDADGNPLTYQWALTVKPLNSRAMMANATTVMPSFMADMPGLYVAQLIVRDGMVQGAPDTVDITTTGGNTAPLANAGPDQTVPIGTTVMLDGNGSRDADGDVLTYRWALTVKPVGSAAELSDPTAARPTFKGDLGGEYVAQLVVKDRSMDSRPDTAMVKVLPLPAAREVYVTKSQWNARAGKLKVHGFAPKGATVKIYGAYGLQGNVLLGTATANGGGKFKLKVNPVGAPCAVQAQVDGQSSVSMMTPVYGAPLTCGQGGMTTLRITKAEWTTNGSELRVEGDGVPANAMVQIVNADMDVTVAAVQADSRGRFEYKGLQTMAPCRVRVGANGLFTDPIPVGNSGRSCREDKENAEASR